MMRRARPTYLPSHVSTLPTIATKPSTAAPSIASRRSATATASPVASSDAPVRRHLTGADRGGAPPGASSSQRSLAFAVLCALRDERARLRGRKEHSQTDGKVAVLSQVGRGDLGIARLDLKRQLVARVQLQAERVDSIGCRRVDLRD